MSLDWKTNRHARHPSLLMQLEIFTAKRLVSTALAAKIFFRTKRLQKIVVDCKKTPICSQEEDKFMSSKENPYSIVLRFKGLFPRHLGKFKMHADRAGGALDHIDPAVSHRNETLIGSPDWLSELRAEIRSAAEANLAAEIAARLKRQRPTEAAKVAARGPVNPWAPSKEGPLREGILSVNAAWFGAPGYANWDPEKSRHSEITAPASCARILAQRLFMRGWTTTKRPSICILSSRRGTRRFRRTEVHNGCCSPPASRSSKIMNTPRIWQEHILPLSGSSAAPVTRRPAVTRKRPERRPLPPDFDSYSLFLVFRVSAFQ
ncbi:hypothetical protein ACFSHQ_24290 [Gemmobacter lanyuensis]